MTGPILFISHDASRTGAPIVLLHLLRWLKRNTSCSFRVLLRSGGELQGAFSDVAPTMILEQIDHRSLEDRTRELDQFLDEEFCLIYSNTGVNGDVLEMISRPDIPVISHIHELEQMITHHVGESLFNRVKRYSHHYIAVSHAVRDNLVLKHGLPPDRIDVVYEFIALPEFNPETAADKSTSIRQELGIPAEAFVVGGTGTLDWRKGPDVFVQLAGMVNKRSPADPIHFLWVGGNRDGHEYRQLSYDASAMGLAQTIHFVGNKVNVLDHFAAMDVFISTSREDPFPLVCLEAASLGKPIICFDKAGGMKEFVSDQCGFVIPYLDVEEIANKIIELMNSKPLCRQLGAKAAEKVRAEHQVAYGARRIMEVMEKVIQSGPARRKSDTLSDPVTRLHDRRRIFQFDLNHAAQVRLAIQELAAVIPHGESFLLVDHEVFRHKLADFYDAIPFLERQGEYWGPPPDEETAVRELNRLRQAGARFFALAWPEFWWLDCYPQYVAYLRANFPCLLENERLLVFDLRAAPEPSQELASASRCISLIEEGT